MESEPVAAIDTIVSVIRSAAAEVAVPLSVAPGVVRTATVVVVGSASVGATNMQTHN